CEGGLGGWGALSPGPVSVLVDLSARPSPAVEAIAYFVVAEALTNVAKHARASHVQVTVGNSSGQLTLVISDDGIGGADRRGPGPSRPAGRGAGGGGRPRGTPPPRGATAAGGGFACGAGALEKHGFLPRARPGCSRGRATKWWQLRGKRRNFSVR